MNNHRLCLIAVLTLAALMAACSSALALDDIAFIIDRTLYQSTGVEARVLRYKAVVEALFPVQLRICSEAEFQGYTPQQIRSYITGLYTTHGIKGVVLVGQIPYALWKNYAPGSNDWGVNSFYYEDLDGTFTDTDGDGMHDLHNWGTSIGPEIWCCWLRPPASSQVISLNAFLDKANRYYFGDIQFNHRALVAAHRDYENNIRSAFRMVERLQPLYGTNIDIDGEGADPVVASEYLSALNTNRYEICDPMGHANAWGQSWDSGWVSSAAVRALTGGAIMTFIYGCHSAGFNETASDNIAQAYVFGNNIGQACSGTSWSYGTEGKWYVYEELARGGYLGAGWMNLERTKNTPAYMQSRYGAWLDTNRHLWGDNLIGNPFVYAKYVPPQPISIAAAKALPDGKAVVVTGGVVTANFGTELYIEQPNRACGIRVAAASGVQVGRSVKVTGVTGVSNGERAILFGDVTDLGAANAIKPLAMPARSLAGRAGSSGAGNVGLLVKVAGKVTAYGTGWFTIDDGSGLVDIGGKPGVRVRCEGIAAPQGGFRTVTGISTTYGGHAFVRVRTASDIASP